MYFPLDPYNSTKTFETLKAFLASMEIGSVYLVRTKSYFHYAEELSDYSLNKRVVVDPSEPLFLLDIITEGKATFDLRCRFFYKNRIIQPTTMTLLAHNDKGFIKMY